MKLYLLRHGRSTKTDDWKGKPDLRPLVDEEQVRVQELGEAMAAHGITFRKIAHSPVSRAHQTAAILAAATHFSETPEPTKALASGVSVERSVQFLGGFPCDKQRILFVGHQKVLCNLASYLTTGHLYTYIDLPKLGTVVLDIPEFTVGSCAFLYRMWRPEDLLGS